MADFVERDGQSSRDSKASAILLDHRDVLEADPVLAALQRASEEYLGRRTLFEQQDAELRRAQADRERLEEENRELLQEQQRLQALLAREQRRAARHKERAQQLSEGLQKIHRALFEGNIFNLILKCCLTITGATRGLYLTARGSQFKVRAAVDVDGYPASPPSEFVKGICSKVIEANDSFVWNDPKELSELPLRDRSGEDFANLIAAPVVLLSNLNGVIIVGDKLDGDFNPEDVEAVLSVGDQAGVALRNQQLQRDLESAYLSIVSVLADAVEAKDPYTFGHCALVSRYCRLTARRLNLPDTERAIVCYGGLLHDVGKIGISDGVLNKPGKLLPEEWELMRSHVRVGRDLLSRVPVLNRVADVVLHHHESYDGNGYPDGLKGDEISLPARIVCVVDAYCAMISRRSYKDSYSNEKARSELLRCRGKQFDPAVVDAFLAVLDNADEEEEVLLEEPSEFHTEDFRHAIDLPFRTRIEDVAKSPSRTDPFQRG